MFLCYIDESGDEQPLRTRTDPPVLAIGGLIVEETHARALIWDFLKLKKEFNPSLQRSDTRLSELFSFEMKGSDLRSDIRSSSRRRRVRAFAVLGDVLALLEEHHVLIVGEIHVKGAGSLSRWVYSEAIASLAREFESQLRAANSTGMMVLDARTKNKNVPSVQRITTKRFKSGGGVYEHLIESPVFGHSDAHVVLQLTDIVVSALLFTMACAGYCLCLIDNAHPSSAYIEIRDRFGQRLRLLEHRYLGSDGRRSGGLRVFDHMNHQPTLALFEETEFRIADWPEVRRPLTPLET